MLQRKEVIGGALFCALGLGALMVSLDWRAGTALNMGPGYFPRLVSGLIALLGAVQLLRGILSGAAGERIEPANWRALALVSLALVAFALLIGPGGIIPAVAALIGIGWYADPLRNPRHLPGLLAVGIAMPILIFNVGLNMHLKLWGFF